jgi:glycosyltransferase involved in cell wall biosynthesis
MPTISVIVPVYNARSYIDRCITSILEQSFSDFEVIFVDDGSIDRSVQAVKQFARNDSRIMLQEHAVNLGPGAARNTGIAKARARYLTFIDSDDYIDPNLLERLYEASDREFFDIVESGCRAVDDADEILWEYTPIAAEFKNLQSVSDSMLLLKESGMPQKLWKKTLFDENEIRFPEGVFWEDFAVVPILAVCARSLAKIDFVGYNYVQHNQSITNTRSVKHIADLFRAHEYLRTFLIRRGAFDKYGNAFEKSVKNAVLYIVNHMQSRNLSDPDFSEKLVRICRIVADQYLTDNTFIAGVPLARLDAAIEDSLTLDFNQADATLQSAIGRIWEANRAN